MAAVQLHREFFWLFVRRDLSVRYAGSILGAFWNLLHPLVMIGIYIIIFSSLMPGGRFGADGSAGTDYGRFGYAVHLCSGLIPWLLFADVLNRSINVLLENGNFLQKVSFPPVVLFTAVLFNALLIYTAGWIAFLIILAVAGAMPPLSALAVPIVMFFMGLAAMGLGLVLAGLNVFFRDTAQVLTVVMQVWFWLNPIVYYREHIRAFNPAVPMADLTLLNKVGRSLITLNPVARFIDTSQWLLGDAAARPGFVDWIVMGAFVCASLIVGLALFRKMLPDVRDCL